MRRGPSRCALECIPDTSHDAADLHPDHHLVLLPVLDQHSAQRRPVLAVWGANSRCSEVAQTEQRAPAQPYWPEGIDPLAVGRVSLLFEIQEQMRLTRAWQLGCQRWNLHNMTRVHGHEVRNGAASTIN